MASPERIIVGEVRVNGCATIEAIALDSDTIEDLSLLHAHERYSKQLVLENHKIKLTRGRSCSDYIYYKICQYPFFKLRVRHLEIFLYDVLEVVKRVTAKMRVELFRGPYVRAC
jgi:hypothetical protein